MSLTVTEKGHWKQRISQRIEKAILRIYALNPGLKEKVQAGCRNRAINCLDIGIAMHKAESLAEEIEVLIKSRSEILRVILTKITGDDDTGWQDYHVISSIEDHIEKQMAAVSDAVLSEIGGEAGRRIVKLTEEQANLLDTIWLATAPSQIRELVEAVGKLLGESPTELTEAAMATRPEDVPPAGDQPKPKAKKKK